MSRPIMYSPETKQIAYQFRLGLEKKRLGCNSDSDSDSDDTANLLALSENILHWKERAKHFGDGYETGDSEETGNTHKLLALADAKKPKGPRRRRRRTKAKAKKAKKEEDVELSDLSSSDDDDGRRKNNGQQFSSRASEKQKSDEFRNKMSSHASASLAKGVGAAAEKKKATEKKGGPLKERIPNDVLSIEWKKKPAWGVGFDNPNGDLTISFDNTNFTQIWVESRAFTAFAAQWKVKSTGRSSRVEATVRSYLSNKQLTKKYFGVLIKEPADQKKALTNSTGAVFISISSGRRTRMSLTMSPCKHQTEIVCRWYLSGKEMAASSVGECEQFVSSGRALILPK